MATKKLTSNVEDYLKQIYFIEQKKGIVRIKEISEAMKVTYPSTSGIIKKMEALKLVEHERYGYVRLTTNGKIAAKKIADREEHIYNFFNDILDLPKKQAKEDACLMEHAMSDKTAEAFLGFLSYLDQNKEKSKFIEKFKKQKTL